MNNEKNIIIVNKFTAQKGTYSRLNLPEYGQAHVECTIISGGTQARMTRCTPRIFYLESGLFFRTQQNTSEYHGRLGQMGWEYWIDIRQPHPPPPCYFFHYHNSNTNQVARKVMVDLNWEKRKLTFQRVQRINSFPAINK